MRIHKYIHDPNTLLEQGKNIVTENADVKFIYRVSMVNLILSGMSPKTLSEFCGYSERTLQNWLKNVDESGWETLMSVKQNGRPCRLTDSQISSLHDTVKSDPEDFGYHVWDGQTLSDYIYSEFGIDYGVRASQYLLHRMGFSLIRPRTYPSLEDPDDEARDDFKKNDTSQPKREINPRVSRRSAFPGTDNYNKKVG